jgi:RNA polymerase sigma-70 factor (ECF subfamily)
MRARLGNHQDYEDLVQETFFRIVRMENIKEKLSRGEAQTRSYLFSIASNLIKDRHRKALMTGEIVDNDNENSIEATSGLSVEDNIVWQQERKILEKTILSLDTNCRNAFVFNRVRGLSYQEVANRMHISVSMVEKHIMRALVAIRQSAKTRE